MRQSGQNDPELAFKDFRLFQCMMYEQAGIAMSDCKQSLVEGRLRKRLRQLGLGSYRDYYDQLADDPPELRICINLLTTNETYFFRHKRHWDFFSDHIIRDWLAAHSSGASMRVWSAAASTGEEAYSAAILLNDSFNGQTGLSYVIEASDINEDVLRRAREGTYSDYSLQKLTPGGIKRYFAPTHDGRHQVCESVRGTVHFLRRNLLEMSSGPAFDVVFLRNVIIYFDNASKAKAIEHVSSRLRKGGYLFLGGAESLSSRSGDFSVVEPTIYRKL